MKAKVAREYYRVFGREYESPTKAIAEAYRFMADEAGKPGWHRSVQVERVAVLEKPVTAEGVFANLFEQVTEVVTGTLTVMAPGSLAESVELSRYHPVNGWVVPDEIEVLQ